MHILKYLKIKTTLQTPDPALLSQISETLEIYSEIDSKYIRDSKSIPNHQHTHKLQHHIHPRTSTRKISPKDNHQNQFNFAERLTEA
jgi:hypothetical protein